MKTNSKHEMIARTARRQFEFVAILALMLSAAGVCRAQSSATVAPVPAARPASPAAAPKGQHEGITLHGRWVIEVKNPDGTVTARREFENSVQPVGENFLVALLSGNNSPGGLSILLNGAHAAYPANEVGTVPFPLAFSQSDLGPCLPLSVSGAGIQSGGASGGTTCLLATAASYFGGLCFRAQVASGTNSASLPVLAPSPCSNNLTATGNIFTEIGGALGQAPELTLKGTVTATTSLTGQMVNDVESVFTTCDGGSTPLGCNDIFDLQTATVTSTPGNVVVGVNLFTLRKLDGGSPNPVQADDPDPVPYAPGQTISVTVTFSFQ